MDRTAKNWRLSGIFSLVLLTLLTLKTGYMNPLVPMPFYLVFLTWIILYGVIAVMPALYIFHFLFVFSRENPARAIMISTAVFSLLNIIYFWNCWIYGTRWQGAFHTRTVALENLVGFAAVLVFLVVGKRRFPRHYLYASHLLLFILLTWCAFPYLGELP